MARRTLHLQIIETIATQALALYSKGSYIKWEDLNDDERPTFDEAWFWHNFESMVDEAVMALSSAVESWVTIEYEEVILESLRDMRAMFRSEMSANEAHRGDEGD